MEGAKSFDAYEVVGVIAPGTVVTLLLALENPSLRTLLGKDGLSVGDFGLFLVLAFVLGHLLQALGNVLEVVVWPISGLPTNRARFAKTKLVTAAQRDALQAQVAAMEGDAKALESYDREAWRAVTTRAYGVVRAAGRTIRIDNANRTYALGRGLTAAFGVCLVWYVVMHRQDWQTIAALAVMLAASVWRMRRAGVHYARALLLEFIDTPSR